MKKLLIAIFMCLVLIFPVTSADQSVTTVISFHHSVTENGNIQVRQITEYVKDGEVINKKYGDPMTPADTKDMAGWDDRSKDIVEAITDEKVIEDFKIEKQKPTGIGVEEIITYDRVIEKDGKIAVRKIIRIFDNGVEVSKKFHRSWIMPGDDPSNNDVMSKAIALKIHTPEVVAEYKAKMAEVEEDSQVKETSETTNSITGKIIGNLGNSVQFNFQAIKQFLERIFGIEDKTTGLENENTELIQGIEQLEAKQ